MSSASDNSGLWEILVPKRDSEGNKFSLPHHHKWDAMVREVSGGITIMNSAKGEWISPSGEHYVEPMIPVRLIATRDQVDKILSFTVEHYKQLEVLAYRLADEIIFHKRS